MEDQKILLIDDMRTEAVIYNQYGFKPTHIARTFDEGIEALKDWNWDILYLDHDLGDPDPNKTGYGIMKFLEENRDRLPSEIVLVTANPVGRQNMMAVIKRIYE